MHIDHVSIVRGDVPDLLQTECATACFDNCPKERRGGDGVDVMFDQ